MGSRKRFSAQEKLNILLASFRKDRRDKEVQAKAGVSSSVFHKWRKRLFSAALDALEDWNVGRKRKDFRTEKEKELERALKEAHGRIDYLATELEVLKKKTEIDGAGVKLWGYTKVPKHFKMDILNIIEASPLPKQEVVAMFGMDLVRYYRWQKRYYFTNSLEDKRGARKKLRTLKDIYRPEVVGIRRLGEIKGFVIGPERIVADLEDQGIIISHETARQILHNEGLIKERPIERKHEWQRFEAENPNDLWQMDILYVFIHGSGYYYLYSLLDDYSRKLIHCALSPTASAKEAVWTLKEAIKLAGCRPKAVLTDRGTQFYSGEGKAYGAFENYLKDNEIEHKVARYRHPQTLGKLERYHRTLRVECLRHYDFDDPLEAIRVIKDFNRRYNHERKHQGIGRVTPQDRYTGRDKEIKKMRIELRRKVREDRRLQNLTEEQIVETATVKEIVAKLSFNGFGGNGLRNRPQESPTMHFREVTKDLVSV